MIREVPIMELAPQGIGPGKVYVSAAVREMMDDWMLERFGVYEGLTERNGVVEADCRSCGEASDIYCGPEEFDPDHHYCGRSERCCP